MAEQDRDRIDLELLRQYANGGSAAAFAELVRRHVDLVYSAALRQVRDRHHAEDVTQATFIVLARRAQAIGDNVVVAGWLLNAARYCSRDLLKREGRRRRHEDRAAREKMRERTHVMPDSSPPTQPDAALPDDDEDARELRAMLDGAMAKLGDAGRDAIVLRFFQQKSFREVGAALGISEEAAKQRVFRAVQRLRGVMEKRGVSVSAAGLGTFLGANAVHAAPPGLAATAAATALKAVAVTAGATAAAAAGTAAATSTPMTLAKGAVTIMTWTTKAKAVAAAALAILLLGGTAVTVRHWTKSGDEVAIPAGQAKAGAVGLRPAPVYWPGGAAPQVYKGGAPITGTVRNADGTPAAGVEVLFGNQSSPISLYDRNNGADATHAGGDGKFSVVPKNQPISIAVRSDAGYAVEKVTDASKPIDLTLKPWGRVEGVVRSGSKPVPRAKVFLVHYSQGPEAQGIYFQKEYTADAEGRFVIDRAVEGDSQIARMNDRIGWLGFQPFKVKGGQTTQVQIGGTGRPVIGRAGPMEASFNFRRGYLNEDNLMQGGAQPRQLTFEAAADGSFRIDDVPPGKYRLDLQIGVIEPGSGYVESAAWGSATVTVPDVPGGQSDEPLDIGSVSLTLHKRLKLGEPVPDLSLVTADGKPMKLSDLRGKVALVHLWDSRRQDTAQEFNGLKAVHDWYGDDPRFTMLAVRVDGASPPTTQPSAEAVLGALAAMVGKGPGPLPNRDLTWPQAEVPGGAATSNIEQLMPQEFFASPSWMFILDADGRLIAKNFNGIGAFSLVERALAPQPSAGKLFP